MNTSSFRIVLSLIAVTVALTGCDGSQAAPTPPGATPAAPAVASAAVSVPAAPARSAAAKIIFVGKLNACQCTRKTIDATWAELQQALGAPARLPVQQLQIDTEGEQVEIYRMGRPILALPAIYFLDEQGQILEQLQGEVTAAQIAAVLAR